MWCCCFSCKQHTTKYDMDFYLYVCHAHDFINLRRFPALFTACTLSIKIYNLFFVHHNTFYFLSFCACIGYFSFIRYMPQDTMYIFTETPGLPLRLGLLINLVMGNDYHFVICIGGVHHYSQFV